MQIEGENASDFAFQNLQEGKQDHSDFDSLISIYLSLINADPDWDPNQLLVEVSITQPFNPLNIIFLRLNPSNQTITRPPIDVLSPTNRLKLLAGINLTKQCVTAHDNVLLFFVVIQSDEDKSDIDEEGQEEEDEDVNSSFYILKRNVEELIKRYPSLLTVQVLLYILYF